jgi:hypothetical protein
MPDPPPIDSYRVEIGFNLTEHYGDLDAERLEHAPGELRDALARETFAGFAVVIDYCAYPDHSRRRLHVIATATRIATARPINALVHIANRAGDALDRSHIPFELDFAELRKD